MTVAFVLPAVLQGAVHLEVPQSAATEAHLVKFEQGLDTEAKGLGHSGVKVVWRAVTSGPHTGQRHGPLTLCLEALDMPKTLEHLHINQTITKAQKLSEESVLAIGSEMQSICELARSQVDGLKHVASQFAEQTDASEASSNVSSTIEQLAAQMRQFGKDILERTQRQAHDVEQARTWTNDIVKLGQAISSVATDARILSFNARLESVRIGDAGRGFAVIAGSIKELAAQVRSTNQTVAELAENLAAALPRLGHDAAETSRAAKDAVTVIEGRLREVQSQLAGVRAESWEALSGTSSVAQNLQSMANNVIRHLQFQDRTSQMLQEAASQAAAVLQVAGLTERDVEQTVLEQVGVLGRTIKNTDAAVAPGSIELF